MTGRGRPPIGPPINIRLDPETVALVKDYADKHGITRAEAIRRIVKHWATSVDDPF